MKIAQPSRCMLLLALVTTASCGGGGGGGGSSGPPGPRVSDLAVGQSVSDALSPADFRNAGRDYVQFYKVTVPTAGSLTLSMESGQVDSRLALYRSAALGEPDLTRWAPHLVAENDDADPYQANAALTVALEPGTYVVAAGAPGLGAYGLASALTPGSAPDITGVWAGTWEGDDPVAGRVSGNWEVVAAKTLSGVGGSLFLSGDVDCADGEIWGTLRPGAVLGGPASRAPCPLNDWYLTALDLPTRTTRGVWTQRDTNASGTFSGTQIATPGGPRITSVSPPGGLPGTVVTLAGSGFSGLEPSGLGFNNTPAAEVSVLDDTRLAATVPEGATSGQLFLTTDQGLAISPRPFSVAVTAPGLYEGARIPLGGAQHGVAVHPDGRLAYVAFEGPGGPSVALVDTASGSVRFSTAVPTNDGEPVRALAVSPDGRRLYAAAGSRGVAVLHGANLALLETLPVPAGGGAENPQGLAVSPDGALLFVADARAGGAVRVVDLATRGVLCEVAGGAEGSAPSGVAAAPDGSVAYALFAEPGAAGRLRIFGPRSGSVLATVPVGSGAAGIAVSPDGERIYVSSSSSGSVDVVDRQTQTVLSTRSVGAGPAAVAVSPDGSAVYVACRESNEVWSLDPSAGRPGASTAVNAGPLGLALTPDGKRAYVALAGSSEVVGLGGPLSLKVHKGGSGLGTVTSVPEGIDCGSRCSADFDLNTRVTLVAAPYSGSYLEGWQGDADCQDGLVTLEQAKQCTAVFQSSGPPPELPDGIGGGGGGCFLRALSEPEDAGSAGPAKPSGRGLPKAFLLVLPLLVAGLLPPPARAGSSR